MDIEKGIKRRKHKCWSRHDKVTADTRKNALCDLANGFQAKISGD